MIIITALGNVLKSVMVHSVCAVSVCLHGMAGLSCFALPCFFMYQNCDITHYKLINTFIAITKLSLH